MRMPITQNRFLFLIIGLVSGFWIGWFCVGILNPEAQFSTGAKKDINLAAPAVNLLKNKNQTASANDIGTGDPIKKDRQTAEISVKSLSKLISCIGLNENLELNDNLCTILEIEKDQKDKINSLIDDFSKKVYTAQGETSKINLHTDDVGATIVVPVLPGGNALLNDFRDQLRKILPDNKAALLEGVSMPQFREALGMFGTEPILIEVIPEQINDRKIYRINTNYGLKNGGDILITSNGHAEGVESEGGRSFAFEKLPKRLSQFFEMK